MTAIEIESMTSSRLRGPLTTRWFGRTLIGFLVLWVVAGVVPAVLGSSSAWRAFGAGLVVPGSGLLIAIPPPDHHFGRAMVVGHGVVVAVEIAAACWALRRYRVGVAVGAVLAVVALAVGIVDAPGVVVLVGHTVGFLGVLVAAGWAFMFRCIARSDYVTLPVITVVAAAAGAALAVYHGDMPGPLAGLSWLVPIVAAAVTISMIGRELMRHRAAQRVGAERANYLRERSRAAHTNPVPLRPPAGTPMVCEASVDQLALLRHLLSIAMRPVDVWDGFDAEGPGPLQQYRYQLNALGWALAMFAYSHTPALRGPVHFAQSNLLERMRDKAVWGYWYWENLLGNWDFRRRRPDPIDVPQNIMFTGYLNLQLGMFRQATGDLRFTEPGALEFARSQGRSVAYDHDEINAIVLRNFGSELCLWPCEPLPIGRSRARGLVFPYCNAVSAAGVAVLDALRGSGHAAEIVPRLRHALATEFTAADGDIVTFLVSGLGLTARAFRGPTTTAGIAGFLAPLLPELGWRAWEILRRDWLDTGRYRQSGSAGTESPTAEDWGSRTPTNAEPLAAAMLLAQERGERDWHTTLWRTAVEQLGFVEQENRPGVRSFRAASVHANGMLGLGGLGRPFALTDMMSSARPPEWDSGPRIFELPHPEVLVAKALTDGAGLDVVVRPGLRPGRFELVFDRLKPDRLYAAHGTVEGRIRADGHGVARAAIDLDSRTVIELRPE